MDSNWDTVGHTEIKNLLIKIEKAGRFSNAILGIGPRGIGKATLFKEFIYKLTGKNFGEHPDLLILDGANESSISSLRSFLASTKFASVELKNTFVLIDNLDSISLANMNVMLKTLEEPSAGTVFFLVSHTKNIPKTIISRCVSVLFSRLENFELEKLAEKNGVKISPENLLASQGSFLRLLQMSEDAKYEKVYLPSARELVAGLRKSLFDRLVLINKLSVLEGDEIQNILEISLGLAKGELVDEPSLERTKKIFEGFRRSQTNMNKKLILQGVLL